jgi:hypothetical protein
MLGCRDGWVFGSYEKLSGLSHLELLDRGRLRWRRGKWGLFTERQIEDSFRHYENLGVALERAGRLIEIIHLDEQQFTDCVAIVSEDRAREALIKFLNLADQDEKTAVGFIEEFGCFDYLALQDGKFVGARIPEWLQEILQDLDREEDPFATSLVHFWAVRDDIKGLWDLSLAIGENDVEAIRQECIRRRPNSTFNTRTDWIELGKAILRVDVSIMLNSEEPPRVVLWEKQGATVALTMAMSVKSGVYLSLLNLIASKTLSDKCPNCGDAFLVTAKRKKYCTDACQNAAKAKRSRERKRQSSLPK